jgi:hypothetical protein
MNLEKVIVVGRRLAITYHTGKKELGEYEIVTVFQSTIQCKSLLTGNFLYFPNPLAPNILVSTSISDADRFKYKIHIQIYERGNGNGRTMAEILENPVYSYTTELNHEELRVQSSKDSGDISRIITDTGSGLQLSD